VFGQQAGRLANELQQTQLVSLTGEPQARGYTDKTGKAAAVLEMIAREVGILAGPVVNTLAQDAPDPIQSNINFDDIPF
jgi:single-stranded DNA-binding protein